jgi:MULE transposase domain
MTTDNDSLASELDYLDRYLDPDDDVDNIPIDYYEDEDDDNITDSLPRGTALIYSVPTSLNISNIKDNSTGTCNNNTNITNNRVITTYNYCFPEGTSAEAEAICRATGLPPTFKNREETKFLIRLSQCRSNRCMDIRRSEKRGFHVFCAKNPDTCNFNILVRWTLAKGDHITDGVGIHTCDINSHLILDRKKGQTPASCSEFLAYYLKELIRDGTVSLNQLKNVILTNLLCSVKPPTIHKAVQISLERYVFSDKVGFALLEAYVKCIRKKNGYAFLQKYTGLNINDFNDDNTLINTSRFSAIFVSLFEQKHYASVTEYACLDATHLLGRFKCVLMSASTLDANKKLIILAQAIMPRESTDCWRFFLTHFKNAGLSNNLKFIISDRDKGLINAVSHIFPDIPHAKCLRHLAENYKKKFGHEASVLLKRMAMAYTASDYNYYRTSILDKEGEAALQWVTSAEPQFWCRSLFPTSRFGVVTSNTIEIVFSLFKNVKHLPFLNLLLFIERYVLMKRYKQLEEYRKLEADGVELVPKATERLEKETHRSLNLKCEVTDDMAAVLEESTTRERQYHSVCIRTMTCSCTRFTEHLFPCRHAICFLRVHHRRNCQDYINDRYKVTTVKQLYQVSTDTSSIATTIDDLYAIGTTEMEPPIIPPTVRGRKKRNRYESQSVRRRNT